MKKNKLLTFLILPFLFSCGGENSSKESNSTISEKDVMVVSFSATGNTAKVASYIAEYYNVPSISIEPKTPYTSEDLNYNSSTSRVSKEHSDPTIRPEIQNEISLEGKDIPFLGYPIWWGEAPNILYTFVESHSFEGMTVIPFATSASSGIGSSATHLSSNQDGKWLEGKRFSSNESKENVFSWIESLSL